MPVAVRSRQLLHHTRNRSGACGPTGKERAARANTHSQRQAQCDTQSGSNLAHDRKPYSFGNAATFAVSQASSIGPIPFMTEDLAYPFPAAVCGESVVRNAIDGYTHFRLTPRRSVDAIRRWPRRRRSPSFAAGSEPIPAHRDGLRDPNPPREGWAEADSADARSIAVRPGTPNPALGGQGSDFDAACLNTRSDL